MIYLGLKSAQDKTGTGQCHSKLNSGRKVKWNQDLQTSARMLILIQLDTSVDIPSPGRSLAWRGKMNRLLLSPAPPDMREHRWAIAAMNCISLCFCDCKLAGCVGCAIKCYQTFAAISNTAFILLSGFRSGTFEAWYVQSRAFATSAKKTHSHVVMYYIYIHIYVHVTCTYIYIATP